MFWPSQWDITEIATGGVLWEKGFFEISQNSQENTYQRIKQEFNLGVGSQVSIILWYELCSCEVSLIWNTFLLTTYSNFSVLSFSLNILPPYSSYCFTYFLPCENCLLFLLSLKTQQWCMPTQPCCQCFFPNVERLIG